MADRSLTSAGWSPLGGVLDVYVELMGEWVEAARATRHSPLLYMDRGGIAYQRASQALAAGFPELVLCVRVLEDDWDNFGGKPPGRYIVFSDVLGTFFEVLLALPREVPGRDDLLRRVFAFGEEMLASGDEETRSLVIDWLCESAENHPRGKDEVDRLGGSEVRHWFERYGSHPLAGLTADPIDLWGVREVIASLLPAVALTELSGTTDYKIHAEPSLAAVRQGRDGVALLGAFGLSHLYAVWLAHRVGAPEPALHQLARDLAEVAGGEEPRGEPEAAFQRIPLGERVWNMETEEDRPCRLSQEPWVHPRFDEWSDSVVAVMTGDLERLPLESRVRRQGVGGGLT